MGFSQAYRQRCRTEELRSTPPSFPLRNERLYCLRCLYQNLSRWHGSKRVEENTRAEARYIRPLLKGPPLV